MIVLKCVCNDPNCTISATIIKNPNTGIRVLYVGTSHNGYEMQLTNDTLFRFSDDILDMLRMDEHFESIRKERDHATCKDTADI